MRTMKINLLSPSRSSKKKIFDIEMELEIPQKLIKKIKVREDDFFKTSNSSTLSDESINKTKISSGFISYLEKAKNTYIH